MSAAVQLRQADRLFDALGDPTRRRIVERISERPQSVSALAAPLGVTLTAVSQHLAVLERAGLVRTRKLGRVRTCSLDPAGIDAISSWLADLRSVWGGRLDRLGEVLAEDDAG